MMRRAQAQVAGISRARSDRLVGTGRTHAETPMHWGAPTAVRPWPTGSAQGRRVDED